MFCCTHADVLCLFFREPKHKNELPRLKKLHEGFIESPFARTLSSITRKSHVKGTERVFNLYSVAPQCTFTHLLKKRWVSGLF